MYQCNSLGCRTFLAAHKSQPLGGSGFDGKLSGSQVENTGKYLHHFGDVGGNFGILKANCCINVSNTPVFFFKQYRNFFKQQPAVGIFKIRIIIGKIITDIAQAGSSQQGIHDSMDQHIGIRMPQQTLMVRNLNPANDQLTPLGKPVYIVA